MPEQRIATVHVVPHARKNELLSMDERGTSYRVRIKAVPEKGKANKELIKFFRKELGLCITIVSGHASHDKVVSIRDSRE